MQVTARSASPGILFSPIGVAMVLDIFFRALVSGAGCDSKEKSFQISCARIYGLLIRGMIENSTFAISHLWRFTALRRGWRVKGRKK